MKNDLQGWTIVAMGNASYLHHAPSGKTYTLGFQHGQHSMVALVMPPLGLATAPSVELRMDAAHYWIDCARLPEHDQHYVRELLKMGASHEEQNERQRRLAQSGIVAPGGRVTQ